MPILLAVSVLAFVALLWATVSIAGFVRRARRRRRRRLADAAEFTVGGLATRGLEPRPLVYMDPGAVPVVPAQTESTAPELQPMTSAMQITPPPVTPPMPEAAPASPGSKEPIAAQISIPSATGLVSPTLHDQLPGPAVLEPPVSEPHASGLPGSELIALDAGLSSLPAESSTADGLKPDLATTEPSTRNEVPPPPLPDPPPPPRLRSFPTRLGKHTLAVPASDVLAPRWNPFSKDFADLTDPVPSRRQAAASRPRNKEVH